MYHPKKSGKNCDIWVIDMKKLEICQDNYVPIGKNYIYIYRQPPSSCDMTNSAPRYTRGLQSPPRSEQPRFLKKICAANLKTGELQKNLQEHTSQFIYIHFFKIKLEKISVVENSKCSNEHQLKQFRVQVAEQKSPHAAILRPENPWLTDATCLSKWGRYRALLLGSCCETKWKSDLEKLISCETIAWHLRETCTIGVHQKSTWILLVFAENPFFIGEPSIT